MNELDELNDSLKILGEEMVKAAKDKIVEKKKIASKNFLNSIDYTIKELEDGSQRISLIVKPPVDKYAQYIELGRKPGKQPPLEPIKRWARYKGIDPKYAYPIARSIGLKGIPPANIFKQIFEKYLPKIIKITEEDIAEEIERFVKETISK